MSNQTSAIDLSAEALPIVQFRYLWWSLGAIGFMVVAIEFPRISLLNFVHVFSGLLWTGIDLFMGFMIGPILRQMDLKARKGFITRLMPPMLFLMPTLAIVATTSGWFMASRMGYFSLPYPQFGWVIAALAVVVVLKIQGFGFLMPLNLLVLFEMRKPDPDMTKIGRWMRTYVRVVASQGVMQIGIIVIMTHFRTGL